MTPIMYSKQIINIFSFTFLFVLNKIINPTPAPVKRPATREAPFKMFSMYKFVKITEAAQFGISPIKLAINGPKTAFFDTKFAIVSSPITSTNI